jgi:hypothetical protein
VEGIPAVGQLIRGEFSYDGVDLTGARRLVHAKFAIPRYPDKFPPEVLANDAGAGGDPGAGGLR